jgi:glycosyltransferase involved in cell wall biosynthesis
VNVIIVTHTISLSDGQGRVNLEVIRAALRAGHRVTLVASELAVTEFAGLGPERFKFVRIAESSVPGRLLKYQVFAIRTALWLWRHRQPDQVVVVNGFITWARGDINAVHFVHDGYYRSGHFPYRIGRSAYGSYQSLFTTLNMKWEKWAFLHARTLVAVSGKVGRELESLGIPSERVVEIPNGVDLQEFRPPRDGEAARAHFGLPEQNFVMLFAGDLRLSRKNIDTVLRALARSAPNVFLAIAGDERGSPCVARVKELGLESRVKFLGKVSEMARLMRSVDAFVFPSCYEPFGLVVLEAMASGLPVVTARSTGAAGLVESAGNFVLDDPLDDAALASFIDRLVTDPVLAHTLGRRARDTASTLSWDEVGQRYVALFDRFEARNDRSFATQTTNSLS